MKTPLASAGLVVLLVAASHATTIRVPEDYPNVLVAVDSAAAGDTVLVGPGVWTETDTRSIDGHLYRACAFVREPISIVGAGKDQTILDAGASESSINTKVVHVSFRSGTIALDGLTLTGLAIQQWAIYAPGIDMTMQRCRVAVAQRGIHCNSLTVSDSEFSDNAGGGGYCPFLTATNCEFRNNVFHGFRVYDTAAVTDCHFEGNGAGLELSGGQASECVFESNGTGVTGSHYVVHDCSFESNDTGVGGSDALVHDCVFTGTQRAANMSGNSEFRDNLIHDVVGQGSSVGGVVSGNTFVHIGGGGLTFEGIATEIRNNTFYDIQGSAITVHQSATYATDATIERNVIVGVTAGFGIEIHNEPYLPPAYVEESCNVLWGNTHDHSGIPGATDIFADPQFCDAPSLDFRVPEGSLLTEEGNPHCGAIGAYPAGCPLTTHAVYTLAGFPLTVDGVVYLGTAASLDWAPGTSHEVAIPVDVEREEDGRGYVFQSWSDGGAPTHTVIATDPPFNLYADLSQKFRVAMSSDGHGDAVPGTAWYPLGERVTIDAVPTPPFFFEEWIGQGFGSYSGPVTPASVEVREPLSEHAVFHRKYTMTMVADGAGFVLPGTGEYFAGTQVVIHGYANDQYHAFTEWVGEGPGSYSGTNDSPTITMQESDITQTAYFVPATTFDLTMFAEPGGTVTPESGPFPSGEPVAIAAHADPGFDFLGWAGVGAGSYAGPDSVASVLMLGQILERAVFAPQGMSYEFSISASATDPYVLTDEPTGGVRNLYLWANCASFGMSSFEGDAAGTLPPLGFVASAGIFNFASGGNLLLAVDGCPLQGPLLLGYWPVVDTGGTFCLQPSAENGYLGPVDCSTYAPFLFQNPAILGFSSSEEPPCHFGIGGCAQPTALFFSQFRAEAADRSVVLSWYAPGSTRASDYAVHRGSALTDALVPLTAEIVPTEGGFQLVDQDVVANETYTYRLYALAQEWSAPTVITTPNWAPLVTGFARLGPNPFRGTTEIAFTMKEAGRAQLAVYDVQGRLVTSLIDVELSYGEHVARWDGHIDRGYAPGGVYFVKLRAGSVTQTRKIVYLAGPR